MRATAIFFVLLAGTAFTAEAASVSPAGTYLSAGGSEITLTLFPNGSYLAQWDVDIFPGYGRASGMWQVEGDEVHLTPKKEEGGLNGYLRILRVRTMKGKKALLRKEDAQYEKNPFFYLYMKEAQP
jgi:hypothetical protein